MLELDDEPREVVLPPELEAALGADADVRATFGALAFTHRREYAEWVDGAKREPTRALRAAKAVEMLRAGIRHPERPPAYRAVFEAGLRPAAAARHEAAQRGVSAFSRCGP